jgi:biotin operon repressor
VRHDASPTARALLALDLVQGSPGITAERLGDKLGVAERAARRYLDILRQAGIPIKSVRGPYGGYRVGRRLRLPPLLFSATEALGLVMAVLDGHHDASDPRDPVGSALGKIVRALPEPVAAQAEAVRRTAAAAPDRAAARPEPGVTSTHGQEQCWLPHRHPPQSEPAPHQGSHLRVALGPDEALIGPHDTLVAAETEGVANGVGVDAEAVAVGADAVPLQGRAEGQDAALFGLDVVDFEVEVELLGVLAVGPLRGAVVLHLDEGQFDLAEPDTGPVLVTVLLDREPHHPRVEGRQLHRVRAIDDEVG